MTHGDTEYATLAETLNHTRPACSGDWRYILDEHEIDELDILQMRAMCRSCPVTALCAAYGRAARPQSGMWAGKFHAKHTDTIGSDA